MWKYFGLTQNSDFQSQLQIPSEAFFPANTAEHSSLHLKKIAIQQCLKNTGAVLALFFAEQRGNFFRPLFPVMYRVAIL